MKEDMKLIMGYLFVNKSCNHTFKWSASHVSSYQFTPNLIWGCCCFLSTLDACRQLALTSSLLCVKQEGALSLRQLISAVIYPGHRGEAEFGPLCRIQLSKKKRQIAVLWDLKKKSCCQHSQCHQTWKFIRLSINNGKRRSNYSRQN